MHKMENIQKKRKWIRKKTKLKIKNVLKEIIVKWYLYSGQEIKRLWLEKREFEYYLKKYTKTKKKYNEYWNKRNLYFLNQNWEKLLNTKIKDLILFENKEIIYFLKQII